MIYNCPKCGLSKSDSAMGSILPQCKCDWNSKSLQLQHYNCNGMPAYEGSLSKDQVLAQPNDFNPDWDAMAVMVEEQQRMAKRIEELEARLAQPEPEPEKSQDKPCVEDDGCPTEKAVLQRFWREHQAQPEQEPVAWADKVDIDRDGHDLWVSRQEPAKDGVPLYTAPIKKEWVELSDEEMDELVHRFARYELIRAVETKLKEKNI